jgi:hypothetical protein
MTELFGFTLVYIIPGIIGWVFWRYPIKRIIALWTGRDTMLTFIPEARHVHHTERILRLTK